MSSSGLKFSYAPTPQVRETPQAMHAQAPSTLLNMTVEDGLPDDNHQAAP
jgi:hypothetical protein